MWQTVIVIIIVAGALFFVGRNFYQKLTRKGVSACDSCGGACAEHLDIVNTACQACAGGPPLDESNRIETSPANHGV